MSHLVHKRARIPGEYPAVGHLLIDGFSRRQPKLFEQDEVKHVDTLEAVRVLGIDRAERQPPSGTELMIWSFQDTSSHPLFGQTSIS